MQRWVQGGCPIPQAGEVGIIAENCQRDLAALNEDAVIFRKRIIEVSTKRLVLPPSIGVSQRSGQPSSALRTVNRAPSWLNSRLLGQRQYQISRNVRGFRLNPSRFRSRNINSRSFHKAAGRK